AADFREALASAQREALAAFGDPACLIEKYIAHPRHIEIQVFGDDHGNVVHLFERDCSLQRRHQKVIEEAPAPGMDAATREAVTSAAVRAAKAVNYEGAGTIEFIADASDGLKADRIWFMEMNTRLQVEHPVTEAVTGVDLVEWQFRVAAGEPIPLKQDEITLTGWAMEARLYAEDPANGFLPSIGSLNHFYLPDDIRVDTGVTEGGEVSQFYDPMIAKLIVHGDTREEAAEALADACAEVEVAPIRTNAAFLVRCLEHPRFIEGDVDTGFIAAEQEALLAPAELTDDALAPYADSVLTWFAGRHQSLGGERIAQGFRLNAPRNLEARLYVDGQVRRVAAADGSGEFYWDQFYPPMTGREFAGGQAFEIAMNAPTAAAAGAGPASDGSLRAPMPGKIVATPAKAGDSVSKGQPIVVLEAMKMEHALVAPFDGVVEEIGAAIGDQVSADAVLARVSAAPAA
ncbi:MAG TPA: biotin/lipoyl-containing protein, partial [Brevundimonas sp.]|nr:biotin/lipoyl-containing protein [Brevundimonas sp.]